MPDDKFPSEENESSPAGFRPEIAWGFIVFHRRTILGAILIVGVGYFLLALLSGDDSGERPAVDRSSENLAIGEESTEAILESVINAADSWRSEPPPIAATTLKRRMNNIDTLLSRDLSESQREFCHGAKIETFGFLFAVNKRGSLELSGIDDMFHEIDREYSNHDNPLLAAKGNLTCLRATMDKYLSGQIDIDRAETDITMRREQICRSPVTRSDFAVLLVSVSRISLDRDRTKKLCLQNLHYVGSKDQDTAKKMAVDLLLSEIELPSLAFRVKQKIDGVEREVDDLFDVFDEYADFPVSIYSVAASCVRSHQMNGDTERASELLQRLKKVWPTITFDYVRNEVKRGIEMLEAPLEQ